MCPIFLVIYYQNQPNIEVRMENEYRITMIPHWIHLWKVVEVNTDPEISRACLSMRKDYNGVDNTRLEHLHIHLYASNIGK